MAKTTSFAALICACATALARRRSSDGYPARLGLDARSLHLHSGFPPSGLTRWVVAVLVGLALGPLAWPAAAQSPGLALTLTTSHQLIAPGGTLRVSVGAVNQGPPVAMDVYFVVLLPDGDSVVVPRGDGSFSAGRLSQLAALPRLAAGVTLPTGFAQSLDDVVVYTFNGSEPWGLYRWYFAAVRPGALADGRIDGGDLLALATAELRVGPPLGISADVSRTAAGDVTPLEGGIVQATGGDGTTYTLTVPPGAVGRTTTVTLTPVTAVTGVPGADPLLAAVQGGPAGLEFTLPARLTIEIPGGVPPAAGLGVLVADDGTSAELLPLVTGATRLEVDVSHFSTVVVPATAKELAAQFGTSGFYPAAVSLLLQATVVSPPDPGTTLALLDHLVQWYDTHVRPLLDAGQSEDFALLAGLRDFQQWDERRASLEQCCGDVELGLNRPVRGRLTDRATEGRTLAVSGLAQAFTRANNACLASSAGVPARLGLAEAAARFGLLATYYFDALAQNQSLKPLAVQIPPPDLVALGLDVPALAERLCVKRLITDVVEPSLGPNQGGTLTVVAGVSFGGAPVQFTPSVAVDFTPDPVNLTGGTAFPGNRTNAAGQVSFPVTATASGAVRYRVCPHVHFDDFRGVGALLLTDPVDRCRSSSGGVVVTPSQTTISPGASRQFTAVVEDTAEQAVSWAVSGGGAITQTGLFTSNGTPGTFFVTATSVANPDSVGIAQVTVTAGDVAFSVSARAETFISGLCETEDKAGVPPLTVSAECPPMPAPAAIVLTATGSAAGGVWSGSAVTVETDSEKGLLPSFVAGFGSALVPVSGPGAVSAQINPGWGSGSFFISLSIQYRGQQAEARFHRTKEGTVLVNNPTAMLTIDPFGDARVSVTISFTCDTGCAGGGTLASFVAQ